MQTDFDVAKLFYFCNSRDLNPRVEVMDFPWLIGYAFNENKGDTLIPDILTSLFRQICEGVAERAKPEPFRERLLRQLKDAREWPNGFLGTENLPLQEIGRGREWKDTVIGMTGVKVRMRRYGTCLGIAVYDQQGNPHEETESILRKLSGSSQRYLRPFVHGYSFSIQPPYQNHLAGYAFDLDGELAVMQACLPDITWTKKRNVALGLVDDFVKGAQDGILVGSYGDAQVFLRMVIDQKMGDQTAKDQTWRQGLIHERTERRIAFRGNNAPPVCLEYFVRTTDENNIHKESVAGVDYWREQWVLLDLARILYSGLYQRVCQSTIDHGNKHLIRFRKEPAKNAAA